MVTLNPEGMAALTMSESEDEVEYAIAWVAGTDWCAGAQAPGV